MTFDQILGAIFIVALVALTVSVVLNIIAVLPLL